MAEQIRVRLKDGEQEVEVQASPDLVNELLDRWWSARREARRDEPNESGASRSGGKRRSTRSPKSIASARNGENGNGFDIQTLVNSIREDGRWTSFEKKILHKKDRLNKVKFVCWRAQDPLTSGEIAAVLNGLGVKIDQAGVSTVIGRQLSSFTQSGARKKGKTVRYSLVGRAVKELESLLNGNS